MRREDVALNCHGDHFQCILLEIPVAVCNKDLDVLHHSPLHISNRPKPGQDMGLERIVSPLIDGVTDSHRGVGL